MHADALHSISARSIAGLAVGPIGLGCMNLSHAYGTPPAPPQAAALLRRALELGVTHFDTAALYGFGSNETLLGEVLAPYRQQIYLASKCGMTGIDGRRVLDGRPETLQRTCVESLARLRTDYIDLYYLHRWDRRVPIEDSVGALAQLVAAGRIRAIGLSEVSAATLRRAHAVHPIAAVQSEYSLWTRNPEVGVLEECQRLGVALVAFSPLGRGFLAGGVTDPSTLVARDLRRDMPRFAEPNFSANARLLAPFRELARTAGGTPAQLALAWLLHKAPHLIPIPGTTSLEHLQENLGARQLRLAADVLARMEALINPATVSGARYSANAQSDIDTEELALTPDPALRSHCS
jgi:aryl-alcohol dehydrogenase-like predicted oxidoreductase